MTDIEVPIWAARLRVLRRGRLWSRGELADRLTEAADETERDLLPGREALVRMIQRWEDGERRPGERDAELLCRAFGVDETELFVGEAAGTTLWHHLTGVPLLPGLFPAEEEERTGRAIEAPERADEGTVGYFRALVDACTRADPRPAVQISVLRPVFAGIEEFRRDAGPPVRRALLLLAAENAELISRVHHENGDPDEALAWSDEAIRGAREAADPLLESYTLAQRSGLSDTDDPGRLVATALAARERGHLPPRMDALARHHEAHGHALAGDVDMCLRRLDESAQSLAEPEDDTPTASTPRQRRTTPCAPGVSSSWAAPGARSRSWNWRRRRPPRRAPPRTRAPAWPTPTPTPTSANGRSRPCARRSTWPGARGRYAPSGSWPGSGSRRSGPGIGASSSESRWFDRPLTRVVVRDCRNEAMHGP
ncbi:multiprotein-bridging factor 1 family protein [Nonomuraea antimicrobica]